MFWFGFFIGWLIISCAVLLIASFDMAEIPLNEPAWQILFAPMWAIGYPMYLWHCFYKDVIIGTEMTMEQYEELAANGYFLKRFGRNLFVTRKSQNKKRHPLKYYLFRLRRITIY